MDFTSLLQSELKPALGVTEVGAIALAAARAYDAVGGSLLHVEMTLNGGIYKNAFSCGIPGTTEVGCSMAALLGVLGGEWQLGLECLKGLTEDHVAKAKASQTPVKILVDHNKENLFISAEVTTTKGVGLARIEDTHSNITYVARNNEVLLAPATEQDGNKKEQEVDFDAITIAQMVGYANTVPLAEMDSIKAMVDMNCALSAEGAKGVGLAVGKTLDVFQGKGVLGKDMVYDAQQLTCSAMDARLAGLPYPAMSIVGSGSHGILASLPVVSYGRSAGKSEEEILRGVALSGLVTIFSKHYTGRLSALCGCVLGGGSGAAAGIAYLMGGGAVEVSHAVDHMAANLTGMICDGGSVGCVLKASAGIYAAFLSAMLAVNGVAIPQNFGVIGSSAEQTAKNLGRVSAEGMSPMDKTVIHIMQDGK